MKKMGLALIIVGVLLAGTGVYLMTSDNNTNITSGREINIKTSQDNRTKDIASGTFENNQTSVSAGMESDTEPQKIEKENENGSTLVKSDPKEIGNAFENFVANLFADRSTFTVLEWNQGTTSTEGVYAEHDKNPDFRINQSFKKNGLEYWVECKYRTPDSNNQVTIKQYQLKRYRTIQRSSHIKIFVAIGTGGQPENPEVLYIVPLDSIIDEKIDLQEFARFRISKNGAALADYICSYFLDHVFRKKPM